MGVVIPNTNAQVAQEFRLNGALHPFFITYGVSPPTNVTPTVMASALRGFFQGAVWAGGARPTEWALGLCRVYYRNNVGDLLVGEDLTNTPGTGATTTSPSPNSAVLVRKVTGSAGKKNRGRMYVPPFMVNESNVDSRGAIDSAAVSAIQTWFTGWYAAMTAASYVPLILHSDGSAGTVITSLQVQTLMATQRLRMRN